MFVPVCHPNIPIGSYICGGGIVGRLNFWSSPGVTRRLRLVTSKERLIVDVNRSLLSLVFMNIVVVNYYTKIAKFIPTTTNIATPKFTALFYKNIELKYGSPRGIVSN